MKHAHRQGKTIIEMLVVIAVLGMVSSMCAVALSGVMKLDRRTRTSLVRMTAESDLAVKFRSDIHRTVEINLLEPDDEPARLELSQHDGQQIRYTVDEGRLIREQVAGDEISGRDQFDIGGETVRFERTSDPSQVVLKYTRLRDRQHPNSKRRMLEIRASIGKDLRFLKTPEAMP